jgi:hypothetical protein
MVPVLLTALFLLTAPGAEGASLRRHETLLNDAATLARTAPASADAAQVQQLRAKLTKISSGLSKMCSPSDDVAKTKVAGIISKFNEELKDALKATEKPKDMKKALKQLLDAQAGVQTLLKEITSRQAKIMAEGDSQEESLLLGVLMQRQHDPFSKQMEVIKSDEFAHLKVVQVVLAAKDTKTPLFKQVALYLDAHSPKPVPEPQIPDKLKVGKDGKPDVTPIVLALESRLHKMEDNEQRMEEHHHEEEEELNRAVSDKKNSKRATSMIKQMKHKADHQFAKESAMAKLDIKAIKSAVDGVKKGDLSALAKAQGALAASAKAAQARNEKFLVLIQMVHRAEGSDCPYCAAQCVDKCHNDGNPYTTCLTQCADAGKA